MAPKGTAAVLKAHCGQRVACFPEREYSGGMLVQGHKHVELPQSSCLLRAASMPPISPVEAGRGGRKGGAGFPVCPTEVIQS